MTTTKTHRKNKTRFVVCIDNTGYLASLEPRKLYQVLPDSEAKAHGQMRIVDESGEDYLYPASLFLTGVRLPWEQVRKKSVRLFSRDAVMKRIWESASAKTHNKAHTKGS